MKKIIAGIVMLIVLAAIVIVLSPKKEVPDVQALPANERAVSGTVVSVNTDQVPVDGPALVTIRQADGSEAVVAVMSMGINLCPAQPNIADVYSMKAGDRASARGVVGEEGKIIPCQSAEHYLRVI